MRSISQCSRTWPFLPGEGGTMTEKRTASDIMTAPVITATEDMLLTDLIKIMADNNITGLPVVDDEMNLSGVISWRLIMNLAIRGEMANIRVADAMSKHLETYGPACDLNTPVEQILEHFARYRINRIIVVDNSGLDRKVLGIICRRDVIGLREVMAWLEREQQET